MLSSRLAFEPTTPTDLEIWIKSHHVRYKLFLYFGANQPTSSQQISHLLQNELSIKKAKRIYPHFDKMEKYGLVERTTRKNQPRFYKFTKLGFKIHENIKLGLKDKELLEKEALKIKV